MLQSCGCTQRFIAYNDVVGSAVWCHLKWVMLEGGVAVVHRELDMQGTWAVNQCLCHG